MFYTKNSNIKNQRQHIFTCKSITYRLIKMISETIFYTINISVSLSLFFLRSKSLHCISFLSDILMLVFGILENPCVKSIY